MWRLGIENLLDTVPELQKYTLAGVAAADQGRCADLAGGEDRFLPIKQVAQFDKVLTAARSVTSRIYYRASGGAEQCQFGAQTLWHTDFFDWMSAKFGDDQLASTDEFKNKVAVVTGGGMARTGLVRRVGAPRCDTRSCFGAAALAPTGRCRRSNPFYPRMDLRRFFSRSRSFSC